MAAVRKWSGRETRALREAMRMSVRSFAAYLGVNERTVTKWEAGGVAVCPRPEMQSALDTALLRADQEVHRRFELSAGQQDQDATVPAEGSPGNGARGRTAQFDDQAAEELRERLANAAAVDQRALALLRAQTDQIREVDRMLGARAAQSQLRGHLATLHSLRSFAVVGRQREALADLYADAAALAGWQALDLGDPSAAWQHYEAAKDAGREARSPAALVHAIAEQTFVLIELGEAARALQFAEHARATAQGSVPQLLSAWLAAVVGEAQAAVGDDLACRRAFDTAERLLPSDTAEPELPYIMLNDVHLGRWRGNASATPGRLRICKQPSPGWTRPSSGPEPGCMLIWLTPSVQPTNSDRLSTSCRRPAY